MKKQYLFFIFSSLLFLFCVHFFSGCLNLNAFLFKQEKVSQYLLDNYNGESECSDAIAALNASGFPVPVTKEIVLKSGPETIYGILLNKDTLFSSKDTIILYFHGTSKHIDYYWQRSRLLCATGFPVFVIDYKGYGKSSGDPTEEGIYEDGRAALAFIKDSLKIKNVILYSYSLGSLVGCEITSKDIEKSVIQLILEAPMGSVETLVEDGTFLDLPGSFLTTYKGDNKEKIKSVKIPLLWMHGTNDETLKRETHGLPVWNNWYASWGIKGWYIKVTGSGHRTIPTYIGYKSYIDNLVSFIHTQQCSDTILPR